MYRSRFLSSLMIEMGYSAVAVGEMELSYGLRAIRDDAEAGLPVICANLYDGVNRIFPPWIIREAGGSRFCIFALLDEEPRETEGLEIRDPVSEGSQVLERLEGLCDVTILLAHMEKSKLEAILPALEGVDVVIRGHSIPGGAAADDCADTLGGAFDDLGTAVLFAGDRGKSMGMARIGFDGEGEPVIVDTTLIRLHKKMPQDRQIVEKLRIFGEEEGARIREMSLSEFVSRDPVTGRIRERYLGIEICARCHAETVADFMLTPHFRAFTRLVDTGEEANPSCLACHTVGYNRFSGYDPKAEQKGSIDLRGVQCEACHGPGTTHVRDGTYSRRAVDSCRACHTPEQDPDFDLAEDLKKVVHCMRPDTSKAESK